MRKYLLPKEGNFYKANLHMHTTVSDGDMDIYEVKKLYLDKGYSIVAFTDHEVMVPHNELTDDNFLAITSTEISVYNRHDCKFMYKKCYHLNFYSKDSNKDFIKTFDSRLVSKEDIEKHVSKNQMLYDYQRNYDIDDINKVIDIANQEGCLVCYNHPVWSCQDYSDYIGLKGLWGVEWFNNGCHLTGHVDSIKVVDDLLRNGENVFPLATDDAHSIDDCFGGFVMVKCMNLDYDTVFKALKAGDFYSSNKPLINDLYYEDGYIYVKHSLAKRVILSTESRFNLVFSKKDELISESRFDINILLNSKNDERKSYFRITVEDEYGNNACTRAYYIDDILE